MKKILLVLSLAFSGLFLSAMSMQVSANTQEIDYINNTISFTADTIDWEESVSPETYNLLKYLIENEMVISVSPNQTSNENDDIISFNKFEILNGDYPAIKIIFGEYDWEIDEFVDLTIFPDGSIDVLGGLSFKEKIDIVITFEPVVKKSVSFNSNDTNMSEELNDTLIEIAVNNSFANISPSTIQLTASDNSQHILNFELFSKNETNGITIRYFNGNDLYATLFIMNTLDIDNYYDDLSLNDIDLTIHYFEPMPEQSLTSALISDNNDPHIKYEINSNEIIKLYRLGSQSPAANGYIDNSFWVWWNNSTNTLLTASDEATIYTLEVQKRLQFNDNVDGLMFTAEVGDVVTIYRYGDDSPSANAYIDDSFIVIYVNGVYEYASDEATIITLSALPDYQPVFDGYTAYVISKASSPFTEATIRSNIKAIDDIDGDITHLIVKNSDTFTPNKNKPGIYEIVYSVTDSASNTSTLRITVEVEDDIKPTVTGNLNHTIGYNQTLNVNSIINGLTYSDNYYSASQLVKRIISDNYTPNKSTPGTYSIILSVKDLADNETIVTISVTVVDDVAAIFYVNTHLFVLVQTSTNMTHQRLFNIINSNNNYTDFEIVSDGYTDNKYLPGKYQIKMLLTDNNDNTAEQTFDIEVFSDTNEMHQIIFETNGGNQIDSQITYDPSGFNFTAQTLPKPTRNGYNFVGWYQDINLTIPVSNLNNITGIQTWYAKWEVKIYLVEFDPSLGTWPDGNGSSMEVEMRYGQTINGVVPTPIRQGYTFKGWSIIGSGDVIYNMPIQQDTWLIAVWEVNTITPPSQNIDDNLNINIVYIVVVLVILAIFLDRNRRRGRR